jgi:hypothetical protein
MIKMCSIFLLGLLAQLLPTSAEELLWKTEAEIRDVSPPRAECKIDDDPCLQADHVQYVFQSIYGKRLYLTYEEGVRAYVSFEGELDGPFRDGQIQLHAEQLAPGAYDWGGVMRHGRFEPLYVIKRFYDLEFNYSRDNPDQTKSGLLIWKLARTNGPKQELLGSGKSNVQARALAEQDYAVNPLLN